MNNQLENCTPSGVAETERRGWRKTPEALARLQSGGSLNRSHAFTAEGRGSSLAPTGRRSFLELAFLLMAFREVATVPEAL